MEKYCANLIDGRYTADMLDSQLIRHRDRLRGLLSFVRQRVPYYREIIPSEVENLVANGEQWRQIPLLEKRQIQSDWNSFLSDPDVVHDQAAKLLATSGSTGVPLKIVRPKHELIIQTKRLWAARARWHADIMQWKTLHLFKVESSHQDVFLYGNSYLNRNDFFNISWQALADFSPQLEAYAPDWIYGSPSEVYRLAEYYRRQQRTIPTLKLIEVSGEALQTHVRDLIEHVFNCPVINQYGCREFWVLAYECPARQMHAWPDDLLLEVIRDGKPVLAGEVGELVVTSLTNRLMPLIRYRLGDFVQMSPSRCSCGNPKPILMPEGGRVGNLIVTRDRVVTTAILNVLFSKFIRQHDNSIFEYQIMQTDLDHFDVSIVPGCGFSDEATIPQLKEEFKQVLPEVTCNFIVSSEVLHLPSGKTQSFFSKLKASPALPSKV